MSVATAASTTAGPRTGTSLRGRVLGWGAVVLVGLVLALGAGFAGRDTATVPPDLDPTSTTPTGTRALVEVLRSRGTEVDVVRDAARATRAASGAGTVFIDDSAAALTPRVARRIAATADRVVLVSTNTRVLEAFGLRATPSAQVTGSGTATTASCPIPAAADARRMTTAGVGYDVRAGTRCLPSEQSGARTWGLVRADLPHGTVTLLGATSAIENGTITTAGNAAFGMQVLGDGSGGGRLTWFVTTAGMSGAAPSLGDLAPDWVTPVLVTGALVALAAAFWRGRRLGPLVLERLPVVVRSAETTEGRARLYARTRDRTHALDTLRIAAVRRIARRLGLARSSHVDAVVEATAAAIGRAPAVVGAVLVGGPATGDADLVAGAAAITELEAAVRAAQRPGETTKNTSTSTSTSTSRTDPPGGHP